MSKSLIVAAGCALCASSVAVAGITMVQVDVNTLTASAGGTFNGLTHTGTVSFTNNAQSVLAGITLNNVPQAFSGVLASMSGSVDLLGGMVQSGSFTINLTDGSSMSSIIGPAASGQVNNQAGQGFRIDGLSSSVSFSNLVGGTHFGGVNVGQFGSGPFTGSFFVFAYSPNSAGVDNNVDLELYATVPAPGAAALLGVAGLAMGRRRR